MSKVVIPLPFMGELMTCRHCGQIQTSDYRYSSGWLHLVAGDLRLFLCPRCAGTPDAQCPTCSRFYDHHSYQACP